MCHVRVSSCQYNCLVNHRVPGIRENPDAPKTHGYRPLGAVMSILAPPAPGSRTQACRSAWKSRLTRESAHRLPAAMAARSACWCPCSWACAPALFAGVDGGVGDDVDSPSRELGGETGVLPLFADGEGELVVGNDHPGRTRRFVGDCDRIHARRREGAGDESRRIVVVVNDVDLLVVQFGHDRPDTGTPFTDAGTLGVHA